MTCRHCVNRREFLASATGLAALATVASCGDGIVSGVSGPVTVPGGPVTVLVADYPALATPGTLVQIAGTTFAAKRTGATTFDAYSMVCTHQGCVTGITAGAHFDCPCHFSRFDANGAVLRGPAHKPLARLVTSYDPATDRLTIN